MILSPVMSMCGDIFDDHNWGRGSYWHLVGQGQSASNVHTVALPKKKDSAPNVNSATVEKSWAHLTPLWCSWLFISWCVFLKEPWSWPYAQGVKVPALLLGDSQCVFTLGRLWQVLQPNKNLLHFVWATISYRDLTTEALWLGNSH